MDDIIYNTLVESVDFVDKLNILNNNLKIELEIIIVNQY